MDGIDDAWVAALDDKLASGPGSVPEPLTVQYDVCPGEDLSSTADADYRYHLVLGPDGDRAHPGPAATPDVTFRLTAATAEAIRSGRQSAEEAFLAGDLDLAGDTTAIIEAHRRRRDG
ncbi:MAG: SCP2 sterol-binding domain-containing protein [Acidimicrobiales bacterium]